jgi:hypothetical protein
MDGLFEVRLHGVHAVQAAPRLRQTPRQVVVDKDPADGGEHGALSLDCWHPFSLHECAGSWKLADMPGTVNACELKQCMKAGTVGMGIRVYCINSASRISCWASCARLTPDSRACQFPP